MPQRSRSVVALLLAGVGLARPMDLPASAQSYPIHFYSQTAVKAETTLSAKWIAAERAMVAAAAARGDFADLAAIDQCIRRQAFRPIIVALENAYEELSVGNGVSATESLARAHAFFLSGEVGEFGVDAAGQVWGRRMGDADFSQQAGPLFLVTADEVLNLISFYGR